MVLLSSPKELVRLGDPTNGLTSVHPRCGEGRANIQATIYAWDRTWAFPRLGSQTSYKLSQARTQSIVRKTRIARRKTNCIMEKAKFQKYSGKNSPTPPLAVLLLLPLKLTFYGCTLESSAFSKP